MIGESTNCFERTLGEPLAPLFFTFQGLVGKNAASR